MENAKPDCDDHEWRRQATSACTFDGDKSHSLRIALFSEFWRNCFKLVIRGKVPNGATTFDCTSIRYVFDLHAPHSNCLFTGTRYPGAQFTWLPRLGPGWWLLFYKYFE